MTSTVFLDILGLSSSRREISRSRPHIKPGHIARHGAPRVARVAGARFANATGAVSRNATPAQRSAESVERDARRARAAAAEAAAARAAAAAVQPTSPQNEVGPTLRLLLFREKPPLMRDER